MSLKKVNKIELAPGIIVYRPEFKFIDEMIVHIDESYTDLPEYYGDEWHVWGQHDGFRKTQVDLNFVYNNIDSLDKNAKIYYEFYRVYKEVIKEYLSDMEGLGILKPYVDYDMTNQNWIFGGAMVQRHQEYSDEPESLSLGFHMDISENETAAAIKHIFTGNVYLNDDYSDGEIIFIYPEDIKKSRDFDSYKMITYKPKRGDFLFYPADWPVSHGVRFAKESPRYLIVSTSKWNYDGSMGEGLKEYMFSHWDEGNVIAPHIKDSNKSYINGKQI